MTITGGGGRVEKNMSAGAGHYDAFVSNQTDECFITVSVKGKVVGKAPFRVRSIPKATATVGGYESGDNVPAGAFRAQTGE